MKKPENIDEYIAGFPEDIKEKLEQVRQLIRITAPQSEEIISYGMPAYKLNGNLVWIGAFSRHIGFYPKVTGTDALKKELLNYKGTKGSVHFPLNKPLPVELITEMVRVRFFENSQKSNRITNIRNN